MAGFTFAGAAILLVTGIIDKVKNKDSEPERKSKSTIREHSIRDLDL